MPGSVNAVEVIWTICVGSGLVPGIINLRDEVRESRTLRRLDVNHGAQFVARRWTLVELCLLLTVLGFTVVGVTAMFITERISHEDRNLLQTVSIVALFLGGALTSVRAWLVLFIRRRYKDYFGDSLRHTP